MLFLKVLNDTIEYWISSSELPQNINMHGANTAVKFVFFCAKGEHLSVVGLLVNLSFQ